MSIQNFNLRVYGLLIKNNSVLITIEHRAGMRMLKFPGGGLEKGEGIENCLIREFDEELAVKIQVDSFYYVNDFFQQSRFSKSDQLISFYYKVNTDELDRIIESDIDVDLEPGEQAFNWVPLSELSKVEFSFPIDQKVARLLSL